EIPIARCSSDRSIHWQCRVGQARDHGAGRIRLLLLTSHIDRGAVVPHARHGMKVRRVEDHHAETVGDVFVKVEVAGVVGSDLIRTMEKSRMGGEVLKRAWDVDKEKR